MENEEIPDEGFFIFLTIDGTEYKKTGVKVTDPNKTIRDQINNIVHVFEPPKLDNGGNLVQYVLGQILEEGGEPKILDFEDEDGCELCLRDYNIQPGDHLQLLSIGFSRQPSIILELDALCVCDEEEGKGTAPTSLEKIILEIGRNLREQKVSCFIRFIVERLNLSIWRKGFKIEYSLSYWDYLNRCYTKCSVCNSLDEYIRTMINQSIEMNPDLRMRLSAKITKNRNYLCFFFERCNLIITKLLKRNCVLIK